MAREFNGPLTADDVEFLRQRYPVAYVERMVTLHGLDEPEDDLLGEAEVEDLLGEEEEFDVLGSTEAEVRAWAEEASDEAKAAALQVEQARDDRDPRKGVLTILS